MIDGFRSRRYRTHRWALLALVLVVGAAALVRAAVPHTFVTGDTLTAADLNGNFVALDQRLATLEAKEPFAGTYPAVRGFGNSPWFCGVAPPTLNLSPASPTSTAPFSEGFGDVVFTSGGAFGLNLSFGEAASACPTNVCAGPITFFLKSPTDQTITVHSVLDDTGAVYVNGMQRAIATTAVPITLSYNAVANVPFSLSFMACSNNGPSLGFYITDSFITTYSLIVDYDATFHRNGK
jgi:hypothetical protein